MDLGDDLYEYLRDAELKSSFERVKMEYLDQLAHIRGPRFRRAEKPEDRTLPSLAEELWGSDRSQWRIHDLALERTMAKELKRGTPGDVLKEVLRALQVWRGRIAAERRKFA
jgi:hypothetical protein